MFSRCKELRVWRVHSYEYDGDTLGGIFIRCRSCGKSEEFLPGLHEPKGGERAWQTVLSGEHKAVFLPLTLSPEDRAWFGRVWDGKVVDVCDCGFRDECVIHCNHEQGYCFGPSYRPLGLVDSTQVSYT